MCIIYFKTCLGPCQGGLVSQTSQFQRTNIPISKDHYPNNPFSKDQDPIFNIPISQIPHGYPNIPVSQLFVPQRTTIGPTLSHRYESHQRVSAWMCVLLCFTVFFQHSTVFSIVFSCVLRCCFVCVLLCFPHVETVYCWLIFHCQNLDHLVQFSCTIGHFSCTLCSCQVKVKKGPVHILGKNCPRSDPYIVHMGQRSGWVSRYRQLSRILTDTGQLGHVKVYLNEMSNSLNLMALYQCVMLCIKPGSIQVLKSHSTTKNLKVCHTAVQLY